MKPFKPEAQEISFSDTEKRRARGEGGKTEIGIVLSRTEYPSHGETICFITFILAWNEPARSAQSGNGLSLAAT